MNSAGDFGVENVPDAQIKESTDILVARAGYFWFHCNEVSAVSIGGIVRNARKISCPIPTVQF